ncbi:unnamed protein product, partial [Penicillium viridicatum]
MPFSDAAQEAIKTLLQELTSISPTPATPVVPSPAIPSSTMPSPPIPAQYTGTRFSDLRGNPVSGSRLAYTKQYKESEAARKAAEEANRDITIIVIFYLQEKPGETEPIPDGLPSIVDFRAEWTDRFFFAEEIQYTKGKYSPRWISGLKDSFEGTVKELIDILPGRKAKLNVVVKRYKNTFAFEDDPWDDGAPLHMSTPSPVPTEAATEAATL